MSENNAGSVTVEVNPDLAPLKRTLRNLLAAVEASEKGVDVTPDFCGKQPPSYTVNVSGKLFDVKDVEALKAAIASKII